MGAPVRQRLPSAAIMPSASADRPPWAASAARLRVPSARIVVFLTVYGSPALRAAVGVDPESAASRKREMDASYRELLGKEVCVNVHMDSGNRSATRLDPWLRKGIGAHHRAAVHLPRLGAHRKRKPSDWQRATPLDFVGGLALPTPTLEVRAS